MNNQTSSRQELETRLADWIDTYDYVALVITELTAGRSVIRQGIEITPDDLEFCTQYQATMSDGIQYYRDQLEQLDLNGIEDVTHG